jgi:hypothetical protein
MVHDDELSEPEITTNRLKDLVAKGNASRPPEHIRQLILAEAGKGHGAGVILETLQKRHRIPPRIDWVMYVLEELRKASERRS